MAKLNFDDDEKIEFETSAGVSAVASFEKMNLKEDLLRGIYAYGLSFLFFLIFQKTSIIN